jgi:hypothetical protein
MLKKIDWPYFLLMGLTVLGVLIVLGMLIGIPVWLLS